MLKTKHALFSLEESITRPVVTIVTDDIKRKLGILHEVWTVSDVKDKLSKKIDKRGSLIANNTTTGEFVNVKYSEVSDDGTELSLLVMRPDTQPIYIDKDIGAYFTPVLHTDKLTLEYEYHNKSKTKVQAIINKLRLFTSDDSMYIRHNLEYHYTVPYHVMAMLGHFNDLKNLREEPQDRIDLDTYITRTFDDRADVINSMDGDVRKTELAIREKQIMTQGYIKDDLHTLVPEYSEDANTWYITLNYELVYQKPYMLILNYPVMIYNTIINKKFRTFLKENLPNRKAFRTYGSRSIDTMFGLRKLGYDISDSKYFLTIPKMDHPDITSPSSFYAIMFSVLVKVDPANPRYLFNIEEIPGIKFKPNILRFILECERNYITKPNESLFYIELYKNNKKDPTNGLIVMENGDLYTTQDMDIKSTYRVVFSVMTETLMLSAAAKDRIRKCINSELAGILDMTQLWDTVLYSYLVLLDITDEELAGLLQNVNSDGEVIFKIETRKWAKYKTKEYMLVLTGVIDEK